MLSNPNNFTTGRHYIETIPERLMKNRRAYCLLTLLLRWLITVLLISMDSQAGAIRLSDSLGSDTISVRFLSAPSLIHQQPSNWSGNVDNILYLGAQHQFSPMITSRVLARLGTNHYTQAILEGSIQWRSGRIILGGGLLTHRLGFAKMYQNHSLANPLVEHPLLWESTGFGFNIQYALNQSSALSAGVTLGSKESGAALVQVSSKIGHVSWLCIGGLESYSVENQDNGIVAAGELTGQWPFFMIHPLLRFSRYLGYDHQRNPTMVSGKQFDAVIEIRIGPLSNLTLTDLVSYQFVQKRSEHQTFTNGTDLSWHFTPWLEAGLGLKLKRTPSFSSTEPTLFLILKPKPEEAELRIDAARSFSRGVPITSLRGNLWLEY